MKDFKTRKPTQRPFHYSWFFLVILIIIFAFLVRSAYSSFSKKRDTTLEKEKYETRLHNLEEKKINLENKIEHLKTDRGLEEELRKRFNISKEGEQIIKIIENQD